MERVRRRDIRAISRLITRVENRDPLAMRVAAKLHAQGAAERAAGKGGARTLGITGWAGVGKSTLTGALIGEARKRGHQVAVVAVDPSTYEGTGALLGDRVRMLAHALDEGVYIRSLSSRGGAGGLAGCTLDVVDVLAGAGFDLIIVETVGVGQTQTDILH